MQILLNPVPENKDSWACLLLDFSFPFQRLPNQPMLFCAVVIRWKGGQVEVCTGLWHPLCPCNGCIQIYLRHNSLSVGRYKACVNWINVNDKIAKAKSLLDPSAKILQMTLPKNFIWNIFLISIHIDFNFAFSCAALAVGPWQAQLEFN